MKVLTLRELLTKYKNKIKILVPGEEYIVLDLVFLRNDIINKIKEMTDYQLQRFVKIDSDFISMLPEIYSYEENLDIKDSIDSGSLRIYENIQLRKLVA